MFYFIQIHFSHYQYWCDFFLCIWAQIVSRRWSLDLGFGKIGCHFFQFWRLDFTRMHQIVKNNQKFLEGDPKPPAAGTHPIPSPLRYFEMIASQSFSEQSPAFYSLRVDSSEVSLTRSGEFCVKWWMLWENIWCCGVAWHGI